MKELKEQAQLSKNFPWHFLNSTAKISEVYSEPSQTSKKELFTKIVNGWSVNFS